MKYDRPDIILVKDDVPKLVIEKTREVPTGHNVGQRFARLVNAVENGVPIIFFLPFKATKHGKHQGVCAIPIRLFDAIDRMEEIHNVDTLITSWDTDKDDELLVDGTENNYLDKIIHELIMHDFNFSQSRTIKEIKEKNISFKSLAYLPLNSLDTVCTRLCPVLQQTKATFPINISINKTPCLALKKCISDKKTRENTK